MMILHFVTRRILPYPGGMQESIVRIGSGLAQAGCRIIVYTLGQPDGYRDPHPSQDGLTIIHLDSREAFLEPYAGEERSALYNIENSRLAAQFLRNAIRREQRQAPDAQHAIVSFYATGTGFLCQMVAAGLGIPHIVSIRGTDFELEVFGSEQHPRLRAAVEGATQVVTTNLEQARMLEAMFNIRQPICTIHNALPEAASRPDWTPPPIDTVRLIADCGFSGRKATQILMRSAARLIDQGLPVSLTVLGGPFILESASYWEERQQWYQARYPGKFSFPGQMSHADVEIQMLASHIYCSATLAEGSSMSRIRALTLGIPMVTTANGGMQELTAGCHHVRLCPPGDEAALTAELGRAVTEIQAGLLEPDRAAVDRWRTHFSVRREQAEWLSAIEAALATAYPSRGFREASA